MNYKEIFIDKDDILLIRKELVRVLGDLNEAVVLNQLNYWIEINKKAGKNLFDGRYWVFNTYQTWKETDFDFWSADTIRRTLTRLENKGIVLTANYNKLKIDKTKWYTIDYAKLQELIDERDKAHIANKENADCVHDMANCTDGNGNVSKAIPENTSENSYRDYNTENTDNSFSYEKDLENNSTYVDINKSFPSGEKACVAKPKKSVTEKDLEDMVGMMPLRARKIAYDKTGDTTLAQNVYECIRYFIDCHMEQLNVRHKVLTNATLGRIVDTITNHFVIVHINCINEYEPLVTSTPGDTNYRSIIDEYFRTEFRADCDYSLVHFTQEKVMANIMNHVDKEGWCMCDPRD